MDGSLEEMGEVGSWEQVRQLVGPQLWFEWLERKVYRFWGCFKVLVEGVQLLMSQIGTDLVLQPLQFDVMFWLNGKCSLIVDYPQAFVVLLATDQLLNHLHWFMVIQQLVNQRSFKIAAEEQERWLWVQRQLQKFFDEKESILGV